MICRSGGIAWKAIGARKGLGCKSSSFRMKIGDRVRAWRETEESATVMALDTVLPDGKFAFWIRFDGDAEDDHFLYGEDGLEQIESCTRPPA